MGLKEDIEERQEAIFKRLARRALDGLVHSVETEELLLKNEIEANVFTAEVMIGLAIIFFIIALGNHFGIFFVDHTTMRNATMLAEFCFLVPSLETMIFPSSRKVMRYPLMVGLILAFGFMSALLTYNVTLCMAVPVVISCRYYTRSFSVYTAVLSLIVFVIATIYGCYRGMVDLNNVTLPDNTTIVFSGVMTDEVTAVIDRNVLLRDTMIQAFLPRFIIFSLIAVACAQITDRSHKMVVEQDKISKDHSRVEGELDIASRIQVGALPIVHNLAKRDEISAYACMSPAKEVGGDFYDIFYIDSTHVALMIADVSDKGVPAALFMMISKLLLDNSLQEGKKPAQVLAEVNHQLCEKALEDMFVTVWLGILDLETGDMVTANGGHEYPLVCRKDGEFEVLKDKHSLALGVMDGVRYKETMLHLDPGDTIFVYTDGVPESNNSHHDMFGVERTAASLTKNKGLDPEAMCNALRDDIRAFVGDVPQFDDTTMLTLRLNKLLRKEGISVLPDRASLQSVTDYIQNVLRENNIPSKLCNKMGIAADEVWSNVVNYSGASIGEVSCKVEDGQITARFRDNGIPFNPLERDDPDIEAALDDRLIGGLGIFMTKRLMTKVDYRYENGWNNITLTLDL